jgi:hypothetical protein
MEGDFLCDELVALRNKKIAALCYRSGMGKDKVKTSVAALPCSVTLEELTKSPKRKSF